MRRKITKGLVLALVALMLLAALFAATAINARASGSEPEIVDGVYQIGTADELIWFSNLVNSGTYDADAVLTADIDMSGVTDYVPIGNVASYNNTTFSSPSDSYIGTFDGQGHVIRNLTIDGNTSNLTVGIFGTVGSGGVVKNLGVDNYTFVKESNSVDGRYGAVAGLLVASRVENCYVINSTVDADNRVGGVVAGSSYKGYIEYCFTYKCTVSAYENGDEKRYGWIVGDNSIDTGSVALQIKGTVTRCYTDGERIASTHGGTQNNCHASVSDESFASGSVACSLMYDNADALWGQNLGTDSIPNLTSATVYSFYYNDCLNNSAGIGYSNIAEDQGTTKQLDHTFSLDDGKCTLCGLQKGVAFTDTSGVPKFYDSITDAISAIKPVVKCGIKLYKDFDLPDAYIDIKNCELTIDLNGKTFAPASFAFAPYVGFGYLTITDSSAEQTGKLVLTGSDGALFGNSSTSITLSGGTIEGDVKTSSLFGGVTQNGGVINGDLYVYSDCTLNSGKLNGEIIYSYISDLYIHGGEITTNRLISGTAALNLTITNGTFTYERDGTSVFLDLNDYTTTVAISGGTFVNGLSTTKTLAEHLAAGYAFFDEDGNAVILSEGQKDITEYVTVAQCTSHDFISGNAYEASATTHSKKCAACGTASENAEEHSGGNATCTALAVCSTCNAEYGTYNHTFTDGDAFCDACGSLPITAENFPDEFFRQHVSNNIDTDANGLLSPEEIANVTEIVMGSLGSYIEHASMEGIQYFTSLTRLAITGADNLISLDVSGMTSLSELTLIECRALAELDFSGCVALTELSVYHTSLNTLDLSELTELLKLNISYSPIGSIDLKHNKKLQDFACSNSDITSLDLSQNTELLKLDCFYTSIASLDLSHNTKLQYLTCANTSISYLDLSKNTELSELYCQNNALCYLDLSKNTKLTIFAGNSCGRTVNHCNTSQYKLSAFMVSDLSRVHVLNGTMDATGLVTLNAGETSLKYEYDTGFGDYVLSVEIKFDLIDHAYVNTAATAMDASGHYTQKCNVIGCGEYDEATVEAHTYSSGVCTDCGYACTHPAEFIYTDGNNGQHQKICSVCEHQMAESCTYAHPCVQTCSVCKQNTRPDSQPHTENLTDNGNGTHDVTCSVCGELLDDDAACEYQEIVDGEYLKSAANCTSPAVYYKVCVSGHKTGETFEHGDIAIGAHDYIECICQYCSEFSFSGSGTENDPYVVTTVSELQAAIDSTRNSRNYIILANDMEESYYSVGFLDAVSGMELDLGGHTLTFNGVANGLILDLGSTVKNGTIISNGTAICTQETCSQDLITLTDLCIKSEAGQTVSLQGGNVYIKNCTLESLGKNEIHIYSYGLTVYYSAVVVAEDVSISGISGAFYSQSTSSFTIDGVTSSGLSTVYDYHTHKDLDADHYCERCNGWVTVFENISLSLGDDLKVNYFISKSDFENPRIRFTINGYTKTVDGIPEGEQYSFTFDGIAPQWIGDTIKAELIIGGEVKESIEYSVLRYLNSLKAKTAAELGISDEKYSAMQTLINDLLVYGGAAQCFVGHNTDNLVSEGVTGTEYVAVESTDKVLNNGENVKFETATVYYNNANALKLTFSAADLDGVEFMLKINDGTESKVTYIDNQDRTYTIVTAPICAYSFDDIYTVTAYKNGEVLASLSYSVKSYVFSKQGGTGEMAELAKATYNYGRAAKAYKEAE